MVYHGWIERNEYGRRSGGTTHARRSGHLPPRTPLRSVFNMRSVHTLGFAHSRMEGGSPVGVARTALSPVLPCPCAWSSRIHLPASLGSPGVTRLLSYLDALTPEGWLFVHESRAAANGRAGVTAHEHPPVPSRSPCFMRSNLPTIPTPTTRRRPCAMIWFSDHRAYRRDTPHRSSHRQAKASIGLRHWGVGSPQRLAESSSFPTDWSFTSCCSPPGLAATQLHSVTKFRPNLARTSTLLIRSTYKPHPTELVSWVNQIDG